MNQTPRNESERPQGRAGRNLLQELEPEELRIFNGYGVYRNEITSSDVRWINPKLVPPPQEFAKRLAERGRTELAQQMLSPLFQEVYDQGVSGWKQDMPSARTRLAKRLRERFDGSLLGFGCFMVPGMGTAFYFHSAYPVLVFGSGDVDPAAHCQPHVFSLRAARRLYADLIEASGKDSSLENLDLFQSVLLIVFSSSRSAAGLLNDSVPDEVLARAPQEEAASIDAAGRPLTLPETDFGPEFKAQSLRQVHGLGCVANSALELNLLLGQSQSGEPLLQVYVDDFPVLIPGLPPDDKGRPPTGSQALAYVPTQHKVDHQAKLRIEKNTPSITPEDLRRAFVNVLEPKSVGTYYALVGLLSEPDALREMAPAAQTVISNRGLTVAANIDLRKLLVAIGFCDSRHLNESAVHAFLELMSIWSSVYVHVKNPTLIHPKTKKPVSYDCEAPLISAFTYDASLRNAGQKGVKAGPLPVYIDIGIMGVVMGANFRVPMPADVPLAWKPRPLLLVIWAEAFKLTQFGREPVRRPVTLDCDKAATLLGLHSWVQKPAKYRKKIQHAVVSTLEELRKASLIPDFTLEGNAVQVHFTDAFLGNAFVKHRPSPNPPHLNA
jgi:hypothetical protein